ncbi:MAG: class I SAM-dependent methyltransferase [Candidatus Bathyarchaeota archaeon]|nr:class I SAM-dependent methyltransferase [Candidatus Bathyarchaeota archaeon]
MNVEEIAKKWVAQNKDAQYQVELWASHAEDPVYNLMPTFQDNKFLQLLEQEHMIDETYGVLDIGYGIGVYSMALVKRMQSVTGIDISPKITERERKTGKRKHNQRNSQLHGLERCGPCAARLQGTF